MTVDAAVEAIKFSLKTDEGIEFLRCWLHGDFGVIRREWPDAPEGVFIGADPLLTPNATPQSVDEYYLQDSRSYVGNDVLWWAKDGKGYTTDLTKAHVYTKDEAVQQHNCRETDIPWPKDYIDARTRPAVDMQCIQREEALAGTGIKLRKPERPKRQPYKCYHCGKFMREEQQYEPCPHCGGDNRP